MSDNIGPIGGFRLSEKLRDMQTEARQLGATDVMYELEDYITEAERLEGVDKEREDEQAFRDLVLDVVSDCALTDNDGERLTRDSLEDLDDNALVLQIAANLDDRLNELDEVYGHLRPACKSLGYDDTDAEAADSEMAKWLSLSVDEAVIARVDDAADWEAEATKLRAVLETVCTQAKITVEDIAGALGA
jgi:hypothetical protein